MVSEKKWSKPKIAGRSPISETGFLPTVRFIPLSHLRWTSVRLWCLFLLTYDPLLRSSRYQGLLAVSTRRRNPPMLAAVLLRESPRACAYCVSWVYDNPLVFSRWFQTGSCIPGRNTSTKNELSILSKKKVPWRRAVVRVMRGKFLFRLFGLQIITSEYAVAID